MRLLISSAIFAITISGLFLFENLNKQKGIEQQAQLQNFLEQQSTPSTEMPQAETFTYTLPSPKQGQSTYLAPSIQTQATIPNPTITITSTPTSTLIIVSPSTEIPVPTQALESVPTPTQARIPTSFPLPTQTSALAPSSVPKSTPIQLGKININTASLAELDNITGVGPSYAKNIIDYRNTNGPFQKIEDIINVSGIGQKSFEKMRNEITI